MKYLRKDKQRLFPGTGSRTLPEPTGGPIMTRIQMLVVAFAVVLLLPTNAPSAPVDDGRSWEFSVSLDGSKIGYHRFELWQRGDMQEIRSEASFDVRFLFVTAFRYRHNNLELWSDDGCLNRIESNTRQNGDRLSVQGARVGDAFRLETDDRTDTLRDCVMTFAYWNPDFLEQSKLLNPQSGEYLPVDVEPLGVQPVTVRGEQVDALAYKLKASEVELTVWYSNDDEWLGLESVARGGRILRYELT